MNDRKPMTDSAAALNAASARTLSEFGVPAGHAIEAIFRGVCDVLADCLAHRTDPLAADLFGSAAAADRLVTSLAGRIDAIRSVYVAAVDVHGGKPDRDKFAGWLRDLRNVVAFVVHDCREALAEKMERDAADRARVLAPKRRARAAKRNPEWAVAPVDRAGDVIDWDHFDSLTDAVRAAERLFCEIDGTHAAAAVVVERVDGDGSRTVVRTFGDAVALRAGDWIV